MINWRIGLSTGCFYNQNIVECLPRIRESGFDTIEVCSSPTHLDFHDQKAVQRAAAAIKELHLEAYSLHAPFAPQIDISSNDATRRSDSVREILRAAEAAASLNAHYFVIHPGPENPPAPRVEEELSHIQHVIDSLEQIAKRCRELGTICVIENKLPHLVFGNTAEILWILDGIKEVEIGACLDTGHAFLSGNMFDLVQKLHSRLKMVHAHDTGGTHDDHWPPGEGKVDWTRLFQSLVEIEFHGAFILELAGSHNPETTMTNARRGRHYLRQLGRTLTTRGRATDSKSRPQAQPR